MYMYTVYGQESANKPGDIPILKPLIVLVFSDTSTCWVIMCRLPEKGRKEIEEMKERNREEKGTEMKVKKQKK